MGDNKAVYALAKILVEYDKHSEIAAAVLQLSECYLDSKQGNIPWKQFPEALKTDFIARIPPSDPSDSGKVS
ncbi:MAG: DUF1636 family protein [Leptolyngbyaceae cyanobacterium SM2_5_2]|nr:DUF1636 family protein [Leptolyngbyaceae cyanobacterium SM2_5_2]